MLEWVSYKNHGSVGGGYIGCEHGKGLLDMNPGDAVTNPTLKQDIQDEISREIQTLGYILQPFRIFEQGRGVVGFAIDDPRKTDPPLCFKNPRVGTMPQRQSHHKRDRKGLGKQLWTTRERREISSPFRTSCITLFIHAFSRTGIPPWGLCFGWLWPWC
jgi:hypothetical protein